MFTLQLYNLLRDVPTDVIQVLGLTMRGAEEVK